MLSSVTTPSAHHHCIDYSKLPPNPDVDLVYLLDPLIATGGTACAALAMLVDWGIPGACASAIESCTYSN